MGTQRGVKWLWNVSGGIVIRTWLQIGCNGWDKQSRIISKFPTWLGIYLSRLLQGKEQYALYITQCHGQHIRWATVNKVLPHPYYSFSVTFQLQVGLRTKPPSSFSTFLYYTEFWTVLFFPTHFAYSNPHQEKKKKNWKRLSIFLLTKISSPSPPALTFLQALTTHISQFLPPGPPSLSPGIKNHSYSPV